MFGLEYIIAIIILMGFGLGIVIGLYFFYVKKEKERAHELKTGKVKKKRNTKMISNLIFLGMMTILVLTLFFSLGDLQAIWESIKQIGQGNNYWYLVGAFVFTALYFILWPLTLALFARASKCNASFGDSFLIGASEHFYNGVTPFAAGGQPFQIYSYTKRGVPIDKATGAILANFVTFMIATNVIAFTSLFFWDKFTHNLDQIQGNSTYFQWIAVAGFAVNFLVLLFMISLGTSKTVRRVINWLFDLICRPKWLGKHLNKFKPVLDDYMNNAQTAFKEIMNHKWTFVIAFLIRLVTMIIYYTIPFFIMKALGLDIGWQDIYLVILGTSFAITSVVFFPTPGGTGGIEFAFSIVIAALLGITNITDTAAAVSILWRLFTYYLLIVISFICSAILEGKISFRLKKKEEQEEAFEELQVELADCNLDNEEKAKLMNALSNEGEDIDPKELEKVTEEIKKINHKE